MSLSLFCPSEFCRKLAIIKCSLWGDRGVLDSPTACHSPEAERSHSWWKFIEHLRKYVGAAGKRWLLTVQAEKGFKIQVLYTAFSLQKSSFYHIKRQYCVKRESLTTRKQKMPLILFLTVYKHLLTFVFLSSWL